MQGICYTNWLPVTITE